MVALIVTVGPLGPTLSGETEVGGKTAPARVFRAGAAAVDVSPTAFPVRVNGGFLETKAEKLLDRLSTRALVLDDGTSRLAIAVVDSCMMPRELLERAKALAQERTRIPTDHILISATHTHSAPAAMGALGCAADATYAAGLAERIAESIGRASQSLQPAEIGWATVDDPEDTHCRRWIRRPDRPVVDPFGRPSALAHMHPGYQNPDAIGPSGPVDPELSVLAVRAPGGRPIALLANYSMHYFGTPAVSADYFGRFASRIGASIGATGDDPPFVGIMSQGTSGDQHWMDYAAPQKAVAMDEYAARLTSRAADAYRKIVFHDHVELAMAETVLRLKRRVPDADRLAWAGTIVDSMGGRAPKTLPEVYAMEALYLDREPVRELKLQVVRIGGLGIAAIPNEVYALTGLKIKSRSPLKPTFTIELANGAEGYIPPPEQHDLGGYTTWPARTAALEIRAEPRIVESVLGLLAKVAGKPATRDVSATTPYAEAVLRTNPWAYWQMEDMDGIWVHDTTGRGHRGSVRGAAFFLDGPGTKASRPGRPVNHAIHLVKGSVAAEGWPNPGSMSVAMAFWNGLPADARAVTGVLIGRGKATGSVFLGGNDGLPGRLAVEAEPHRFLVGTTRVETKRWYHLAAVFDRRRVSVYLDGRLEIAGEFSGTAQDARELLIGSGGTVPSVLRGKLDEVALYDRALSVDELGVLYESYRQGHGHGGDGGWNQTH